MLSLSSSRSRQSAMRKTKSLTSAVKTERNWPLSTLRDPDRSLSVLHQACRNWLQGQHQAQKLERQERCRQNTPTGLKAIASGECGTGKAVRNSKI